VEQVSSDLTDIILMMFVFVIFIFTNYVMFCLDCFMDYSFYFVSSITRKILYNFVECVGFMTRNSGLEFCIDLQCIQEFFHCSLTFKNCALPVSEC